jgi:ribosomal protein S18 acetylase RimI-like enzyme
MAHILDNIFWHSLSGAQACFATGDGNARRYAKGFSPILGFADANHPDFRAIASYCDPDEQLYCADWSGAIPDEWQVKVEGSMFRMVWDGDMPPADNDVPSRRLSPADPHDAQLALALAQLTKPGPFGMRTIELGNYIGCFENGLLVAMAGERAFAPPYRELSVVCTHPDYQGRGLAQRLMHQVIRQQLLAQEIPFLHVMSNNTAAHELYLRMGFRDYCETAVRVICRGHEFHQV